MEERNRRRQLYEKKKRLKLYRILAISLVFLFFVVFSYIKQRNNIAILEESYKSQVQAHEALKQRIVDLETELKEVNTLEYIEKKAREDLGMIKKDETIYIEEDQNE